VSDRQTDHVTPPIAIYRLRLASVAIMQPKKRLLAHLNNFTGIFRPTRTSIRTRPACDSAKTVQPTNNPIFDWRSSNTNILCNAIPGIGAPRAQLRLALPSPATL